MSPLMGFTLLCSPPTNVMVVLAHLDLISFLIALAAALYCKLNFFLLANDFPNIYTICVGVCVCVCV